MSYYELLDVPKDADNNLIKRAYFGAVKQHSPDRDPEGFKAIRAAYETLSDPEKRSSYDAMFSDTLPQEAQLAIIKIRGLMEQNQYKTAEAETEDLLKNQPDLFEAKMIHAEILLFLSKTGKAEKILKGLMEERDKSKDKDKDKNKDKNKDKSKEKEKGKRKDTSKNKDKDKKTDRAIDASVMSLRAEVALKRGFNNKAEEYFNKAIDFGIEDPDFWIKYTNYSIMRYGQYGLTEIMDKIILKNPDVFSKEYLMYFVATDCYNSEGRAGSKESLMCLDRFAYYFTKDKYCDERTFLQVMNMLGNMINGDPKIYHPFFKKILPALENSRFLDEKDIDNLGILKVILLKGDLAKDPGIHEVLVDLTGYLLEEAHRNKAIGLAKKGTANKDSSNKNSANKDSDRKGAQKKGSKPKDILGAGGMFDDIKKLERDGMECYIVANLDMMRPYIKNLRRNYPDYFNLNLNFYTDCLDPKKEKALKDKAEIVSREARSKLLGMNPLELMDQFNEPLGKLADIMKGKVGKRGSKPNKKGGRGQAGDREADLIQSLFEQISLEDHSLGQPSMEDLFLGDLPLGDLPLGDLSLRDLPLRDLPLGDLPVNLPLGGFPMGDMFEADCIDLGEYGDDDMPAILPIVREHEKISRNAPCPCGSGKKYKKCCG